MSQSEVEYAAGNRELALALAQRMIDGEFGAERAVASAALLRVPVLRLLLGDVEGAIEPLRELLTSATGGHGNPTLIELEYGALGLAHAGTRGGRAI